MHRIPRFVVVGMFPLVAVALTGCATHPAAQVPASLKCEPSAALLAPCAAPVALKAPGTPPLPVQKPVTDEPEPVAPARWKRTLKRVLSALAIVLALSLTYVFLLMGEPDEDSQLTAQNAVQEETIRVPIAASEVGGNADLVSAGTTGAIVPSADPEAMAHEIIKLANQPDTAKNMGRAGRSAIEQKFSMEAMVAAYQGAYDKLLHRPGANPKL